MKAPIKTDQTILIKLILEETRKLGLRGEQLGFAALSIAATSAVHDNLDLDTFIEIATYIYNVTKNDQETLAVLKSETAIN